MKPSMDGLEEMNITLIMKMIGEKFMIVGVSIFLISFCIFVIYWFVSQLVHVISRWRKGVEKYKAPSDFDEEYPDDPKKEMEPAINYYDENKRDFIKNMSVVHKDYNKEKAQYIKSVNKNAEDMDGVNEKILFRDYDKYKTI